MSQPQPPATRCPYCGTTAAEWICHICKREKPHAGDRAVGIVSCLLSFALVLL